MQIICPESFRDSYLRKATVALWKSITCTSLLEIGSLTVRKREERTGRKKTGSKRHTQKSTSKTSVEKRTHSSTGMTMWSSGHYSCPKSRDFPAHSFLPDWSGFPLNSVLHSPCLDTPVNLGEAFPASRHAPHFCSHPSHTQTPCCCPQMNNSCATTLYLRNRQHMDWQHVLVLKELNLTNWNSATK